MGLKTFHYLSILLLCMAAFIGYAVRDVQAEWQQNNLIARGEDCRRDYQIGANK